MTVELMPVQGEDWLAKSMVGVVAGKSRSLQVHCQAGAYSPAHLAVDQGDRQFAGRYAAICSHPLAVCPHRAASRAA